jgi:hypothetical protein
MATLAPCLDALRDEFNARFPRRDNESDGWIGDADHSARDSDHNPDSRGIVHAVDVDDDLRDPHGTTSMRDCIDEIVGRHRRGADNRLTYIIYERSIWSAKYGWRSRAYSGSNPHDRHAHFSARYWPPKLDRERNRASFGIRTLGVPVALTAAEIDAVATAAANKVWAKIFQIPGTTGPENQRQAGDLLRYLYSKESIAARVVELLTQEGGALFEQAQEIGKVLEDTDHLTRDPADTNDPEGHPFVMAHRYVDNNPPPA